MPDMFILREMEVVGNGDREQRSVPTEEQRKGRLGDFASICLQHSCSVLCGRTGGWWPPYFRWLQPFPSPPLLFLYILPAFIIPHRPHVAQLAGVAVRSVPALACSPPHASPFSTSILPDIERGAAGHRHWRRASRSPFQFFIGMIWPSSSVSEGRGCPFHL